jgi:Fur family ferric uptake transcriptional regulator
MQHHELDVAAALKNAGLKCTRPREAILHHLVEHHGPFTAKELHAALGTRSFDVVTTYRCLTAFEEAGLARRCDFGDGVARYEIAACADAGHDHHHHHVICTKCRRIEPIEHCDLPKLEAFVKKLGYVNVKHKLEFTGLCKTCAEN